MRRALTLLAAAAVCLAVGCKKAADKGPAPKAFCPRCMGTAALQMKCPNCGMAVKTDVSKVVDGKTVLFCGKACMDKFDPNDAALKAKALAEAGKYKCTCPK